MDTLSQLLGLYPVQTALEVRCLFGAPWVLEHEAVACGVAPYHVVASGGGWLEVGADKDIPLQAGDIVLFPQGAAHRLYTQGKPSRMRDAPDGQVLRTVRNSGKGEVTELLCGEFHFSQGRGNALLAALPEWILVRTAERTDLAGLRHLIALLRAETEAVRPGARAVAAQLASALFALLMRAWLEQPPGGPGGASGRGPVGGAGGLFALLAEPRLQSALQAMLEQPGQPWTLAQLAAACHMSRATFARLFRQASGATPAEMLTRTRMARAATLLAAGRLPVGQIGELVGYQSEAAFNRVFKRSHGVGPGAYRRSARQAAAA